MQRGFASRGLSSAALEVVGELASLINSTYDLHEIFRTVIIKLQKVMEFRRASVLLVSDDRSYYYLHTLYDGARGGFIRQEARFPLDQGLPGQVIRTGEAIRVDSFGGNEEIKAEGEVRVSALIVPLRLDGVVIGTLNLGAKESETYVEEDLELAVLLGRQIETSLHYSKLLYTIEQQREALAHEHEQVRSERTRLEALIEASDAAILMVSGDKVAHVNRAMAELLGLPQEVVVGTSMDKINRVLSRSLTDPQALAVQSSALQSGGGPLHDRVEFEFPRKLTCQRTVATVRDQAGEVLGHLLLYRDVTREAEAEAAKSEFVAIVSHELRTPLTSVKTSLRLLFEGAAGTVNQQMKGLLEIALRNLDRLIRLVNDLLDLSRIEGGTVTTTLSPVSVRETTGLAVEAVRGFADVRAVVLDWEPGADALLVTADADRLEQVIVNLLSNAIKFSPENGRVGLRWSTTGKFAVLEVSDEGPGIPADQLETIFDKFRQLEKSATRVHGGAGLGLAISRSIIETFGGDLWAESEEGQGSRFFVRVRIAQGEDRE